MIPAERSDGAPHSVIVIGAGVVGLSTAWFLQQLDIDVTIVDRTSVAAGASIDYAGWIAPGLAHPPRTLSIPQQASSTVGAALRGVLARFTTYRWGSPWKRALRGQVGLNTRCLDAFDVLTTHGVDAAMTDAPVTAVFPTVGEAERMLQRLRQVENAGQPIHVTALAGEALREQVPLAAETVSAGLSINAQRVVDSRQFVEALGRSVANRGATVHRLEIRHVDNSSSGVVVHPHRGAQLTADAAVIATGAPLSQLAGRWSRIPVHARRAFSFTVPVDRPITDPIYLPSVQIACTPYRGEMLVTGSMGCRGRGGFAAPEQLEDAVALAGQLLDGVRWAEHSGVRLGTYPVTSDGRALIGELTPGIHVAGGHGSWGLTHGPVTGRLLAEQISTGEQPVALADFDPLRRSGA